MRRAIRQNSISVSITSLNLGAESRISDYVAGLTDKSEWEKSTQKILVGYPTKNPCMELKGKDQHEYFNLTSTILLTKQLFSRTLYAFSWSRLSRWFLKSSTPSYCVSHTVQLKLGRTPAPFCMLFHDLGSEVSSERWRVKIFANCLRIHHVHDTIMWWNRVNGQRYRY
jgi:hypothetical protein